MRLSALTVALAVLLAAAPAPAQRPPTIVGLPCEDCAAPLVGLPADPPSTARIAPAGEPGEPLHLQGTVRDAAGRPRAGIILYAHQTDHRGLYPPAPAGTPAAARNHGRLRAWARTDAEGRYGFLTVRPGGYPGTDIPQHIHLHVIEPGCALYYIDDVTFSDDPRLTPKQRAILDQGRGGRGIVTPERRDGGWHVRRDIVLGRNIPGYPGCDAPATAAAR